MEGPEQRRARPALGSERTHLDVCGKWTVKSEKGRGTTRVEVTAMVQAKDNGDWAQGEVGVGLAVEVGRWEVRGLTW